MPRKNARARYYTLYLHQGDYQYQPADDLLDAQQALAYYKNNPDFLAIGIYDPQDWCFTWNISEEDQYLHLSQVNKITDKLRHQFENRVR